MLSLVAMVMVIDIALLDLNTLTSCFVLAVALGTVWESDVLNLNPKPVDNTLTP